MNKILLSSACEYRKILEENRDFISIRLADCDYCGMERKEGMYHPQTCAYCGAELRGLVHVMLDRKSGKLRELYIV